MKRLKKTVGIMLICSLCICLIGCTNRSNEKKEYQFTVMATLFPYYDFTRAIVGDNPDIQVKLLVSPGQDDHSFEPTTKDIIAMKEADLFIYNGGSIENWVDEIISSPDNQNILRMMDYVGVLEEEHEDVEQLFAVEDEHEHEEEHDEEADEHIWTSPVNAKILLSKICDELCRMMPEYRTQFMKNYETYSTQISEIDTQIRDIVNQSQNKEMIFADKFPLKYFAEEYGLKYYAAFPGCSGDTEPSAKTVAFLIDKVRAKKVRAIFYLELSSTLMADVICEDTGVEKYQFNSCHNVTEKQFKDGVTYVELMSKNVEVLKKALR